MADVSDIREQYLPSLDLVALAAHTMADEALQREVLTLFFAQSGSLLEQLSDVDNDRGWYQAAHALKGSARSVGLLPLGDLAQQAETLVGPTNNLMRRAQYHEIVEEVERAREAVCAAFGLDV